MNLFWPEERTIVWKFLGTTSIWSRLNQPNLSSSRQSYVCIDSFVLPHIDVAKCPIHTDVFHSPFRLSPFSSEKKWKILLAASVEPIERKQHRITSLKCHWSYYTWCSYPLLYASAAAWHFIRRFSRFLLVWSMPGQWLYVDFPFIYILRLLQYKRCSVHVHRFERIVSNWLTWI